MIMHGIFWIVTQPVNRHWVSDLPLTGPARRFFMVRQKGSEARQESWEQLRNTWEYSHIVRSLFAAISLISITIAIALYGNS